MSQIAGGQSLNGREWNVEFEEAGAKYIWSGRFNVEKGLQEELSTSKTQFPIVEERLIRDNDKVLFSRSGDRLLYHNAPTVKLDMTKSAVELLKAEDDIAPVYRAFKKVMWLDMEEGSKSKFSLINFHDNYSDLSLKDIKNLRINPMDRLFFIHKYNKKAFEQIKETFSEVFPLVDDIDFDINTVQDDMYIISLKIKEQNVDSWIKVPDISAGMYRTLSQIVTLSLADDGDVIMIDEFENGLGINCIDLLADMAKDADADVQIIMTSHHPYIINTIPFQDWKIVSRKGSEVVVNTAADFRIGSHSKHDAFMQLIQTDAYRTGQA
ncbi:MAG: ATP-binding protein [Muribaculaceae bacterium]|nr:ATP-binding protein [Muribaculaceae bacterium]